MVDFIKTIEVHWVPIDIKVGNDNFGFKIGDTANVNSSFIQKYLNELNIDWKVLSGLDLPDDLATRNQIFAQDEAPTGEYAEGDLWFDTDGNNEIYRANSALTWVSVKDGTIVSGAVTTFYQTSVPTALATGDIWFDTDDNLKMYVATNAGDDEITAGEWELAQTAAEWADILDGAGTKPDDNATEGATTGVNLQDSGSEVLNDTHVKNIGTVTAGETIAGATLPVAVYVNSTDNKFYACDGDDEEKLEFVGFSISNGTDGNDMKVQFIGIVPGFTGLSEGEVYYVQDDKTIGTTPGTYVVQVGIAVSSTEIVIIKSPQMEVVASDTLQDSADTERTSDSTTYVKVKEIKYNEISGTIRVKFDLRIDGSVFYATGRIYVNGVAVGTEYTDNDSTYTTYYNDISVNQGDLVQLYIHKESGGSTASTRNFRLYYDKQFNIRPGTINTN